MAFYKVKGVNVHVEIWNEEAHDTVVLLHGFTGATTTWHEIVALLPKSKRLIAVDLMGHGKTDVNVEPIHYEMAGQLSILHELFFELNVQTFTLIGYSMGGRIALSYAARYPDQIDQLILESASPGLANELDRLARIENDEKLAARIEQDGLVAFIDFWENIPLFNTQHQLPENRQQILRNERLSQNENGLALSLRHMGTGKMPPLWELLSLLPMPVLLMTGELDVKFVNIAKQMRQKNEKINQIVIPKVGHAIHVENPQKFATIVKETIF